MSDFKSYYVFEFQEKYFIFDKYNLLFCTITLEEYTALKGNSVIELVQEMSDKISILKDNHLFFYDSEPEYVVENRKIYFSFSPIFECNLCCKYCFADAGNNYKGTKKRMSVDTISKICNFLIEEFPNIYDFRLDLTGGGEPLFDKTVLKETILTAYEVFRQKQKKLFVWLATNGTLIDPDIIEFFNKYNICFGISLDGSIAENDALRVYKDGKGTYSDVIKSIDIIKKSSYNKQKELWGLAVITKRTNSLVELVKHFSEIGFSTLQMRFVRSQDKDLGFFEADLPRTYNMIDELMNYILYLANENEFMLAIMIMNENDYIGKILRRLILQLPTIRRCKAGIEKFAFDTDGKIYPCDAFVGNEKYILGDVDDGFIEEQLEKFNHLTVAERAVCKECWAKNVCAGDCFHNSFLMSGNVERPSDEFFCNMVKYVIKAGINMLTTLYEENNSAYIELKNLLRIRHNMSNT